MLRVNRLAHILRCESLARGVQGVLGQMQKQPPKPLAAGGTMDVLQQALMLKSATLAKALLTRRHCVHTDAETGQLYFDPRFLVFEFCRNMVLRKQQYQLVLKFMAAVSINSSLCHQMIMVRPLQPILKVVSSCAPS